LIAQEAKYHPRCLVLLYNRAAALQTKTESEGTKIEKVSHGIALAELLAYIEESRLYEEVAPIFKLSDLVQIYSSQLEQLSVKEHACPHCTELKKRILAQIPDLKAHKEGCDVLLAFDEDIGPALRRVCDDDYDSEAICLVRAARIIWRDMFSWRQNLLARLIKAIR